MQVKCFYCDAPITSHLDEGTVFRGVAECPECIDTDAFQHGKTVIFYAKLIHENYSQFLDAYGKGDKESMLRLMKEGSDFFNKLSNALAMMKGRQINGGG